MYACYTKITLFWVFSLHTLIENVYKYVFPYLTFYFVLVKFIFISFPNKKMYIFRKESLKKRERKVNKLIYICKLGFYENVKLFLRDRNWNTSRNIIISRLPHQRDHSGLLLAKIDLGSSCELIFFQGSRKIAIVIYSRNVI